MSEKTMKDLFRRNLTMMICAGTLIVGIQSWAAETKQVNLTTTEVNTNSKNHEKYHKPSDIKIDERAEHDHSKMSDMSQMDHSKMGHSEMMSIDHAKMNMPNNEYAKRN